MAIGIDGKTPDESACRTRRRRRVVRDQRRPNPKDNDR
ncbi:hypothetical protein BZL30_8701 [Mycobacterium kansasii]|uniref:Uncharacterized protein n=1 Tax=Mycobacterium kansasii TaxID=1768 RepID=A0A1V3WFT5_MYCKA|nr:hypothetical protein BZL30_8701 [Mycobacterium kansasii]